MVNPIADSIGLKFQVTPNLYGNLVANTAAGIAGGTGVMPGGMRTEFPLCIDLIVLNYINVPLYGNCFSETGYHIANLSKIG